jgi:hypothetical protein
MCQAVNKAMPERTGDAILQSESVADSAKLTELEHLRKISQETLDDMEMSTNVRYLPLVVDFLLSIPQGWKALRRTSVPPAPR